MTVETVNRVLPGAAADGVTNDGPVIQKAIDECSNQGGGTVTLAGGTYLSGTLRMKSNVTLNIDASATLLASPNIGDYAADVHHNRYRNETALDRCFIFAEDAVSLTATPRRSPMMDRSTGP